MLRHDIRGADDLHELLDAFYRRAIPDPVIGHYFTEVVRLDLSSHLPKLVAFWNQILFGELGYQGNPMFVHRQLDAISPFEKHHFDRWIELFVDVVDEHFEGEVAELAKEKGRAIATLMVHKIVEGNRGSIV